MYEGMRSRMNATFIMRSLGDYSGIFVDPGASKMSEIASSWPPSGTRESN